MLKSFFITCLLATKCIVAQDLTASQNIPATVAAGSSFIVEIEVNRNNISGFMKFYQELPQGFTAIEMESKGGSFSSLENGVKIVWIAPPSEVTYSVRYKINVPVDAAGTKTLTAKYSYIKNNERSFFELEPKTITIENAGTLAKAEPSKVLNASFGDNAIITNKSTENAAVEKKSESSKGAISSENDVTASKSAENTVIKTTKPAIPAKTYRVQIGAFTAKPNLTNIAEITTITLENGITKYFSGNFDSREQAAERQEKLSKAGFPKAFIVPFENGKIVK